MSSSVWPVTSTPRCTANKTGDSGVVYGLTTTGAVRGTLNYRTKPVDVEGLAVVNDTLYVGDIGDRTPGRSFVTVYRFDNPRATGLTVTYRSYDFAFRDGPKNAETLLVTDSGRILLVTAGKEAAICRPAAAVPASSQSTHEGGGRTGRHHRWCRLAGRQEDRPAQQHDRAYILDASSYETVASAEHRRNPRAILWRSASMGNTCCWGTQGRNAKVYSIPVPAKVTPSPSPSSTDGQSDVAEAAGPGRRGTLLALGVAAAVAVVAGVVAGVIRDR